jgi:hypothetical protein
VLCAGLLPASGGVLRADDASKDDTQTIPFNHAKDGPSAAFSLRLKPKEKFVIDITNTAEKCFDYDVENVPFHGAQAGDIGRTEVSLPIVHEDKYGGYIVHIRRKKDLEEVCNAAPAKDLKDATIIIAVETLGVEVAFGGGFTISQLTDPVYAARPAAGGGSVVERDKSAEDDFSLGVAAFLHVYGKSWPKAAPAVTFGLGINGANEATYYVGPFWRLGDQAYLGGGVVFGSVARLPTGVHTGDPITDPNVLTDLPTRTDAAAFVGFSYTFLGNKEAFQKPFKSVDASQVPVASPATDNGKGQSSMGNDVANQLIAQGLRDLGENINKTLKRDQEPYLQVTPEYTTDRGVIVHKTQIGNGALPYSDVDVADIINAEAAKQKISVEILQTGK